MENLISVSVRITDPLASNIWFKILIYITCTAKNIPEYGFYLTHVFPCRDKIEDSVSIQKNTGQRKHISYSGIFFAVLNLSRLSVLRLMLLIYKIRKLKKKIFWPITNFWKDFTTCQYILKRFCCLYKNPRPPLLYT